jgi:hypothetical protein
MQRLQEPPQVQQQQRSGNRSHDGLVMAATKAVQLISEVGVARSSSVESSSLAGTMNSSRGQAQPYQQHGKASSRPLPTAPQLQQRLQLSQHAGEMFNQGQGSAPPVLHSHYSHIPAAAAVQYQETLAAQMRAVYGISRPAV